MTIPNDLQPAVTAAVRELAAQVALDEGLVVSEISADGLVQIEGTVDLAAVVQSAVAAHVADMLDGTRK